MIIGIDGNEANIEKRVGIGEYAFELLTQFVKQSRNNQFYIYLKHNPVSDMPPPAPNWVYKVFGPTRLWTQFTLPAHLYVHTPRPDIFFTPSHYAPRVSPVRTAISIMDVSYLYYPHLFARHDLLQLRQWTKYSAKNASRIFTISQSSKHDIIKHYKVKADTVVVTYPGIKELMKTSYSSQHISSVRSKYSLPLQYILFVGTIQPRKNLTRLIEAFANVSHKNQDTHLVIVGKKGWLYESILQAPDTFNITSKVHFLDFVSDEDLPVLYQHAEFFILPSLYEGFGLPILEAMKNGCAVITSNVSSLPEAGGDAAVYVNPESVEDIAEKMVLLLSDKVLRDSYVKKGYEHIKKFSWKKTAKETLDVLEDIYHER